MYQYNFGFLSEWIEANKDIPKGAIIQALGIKSNNGVNAWIDKRHPMPVISMLRFCNTFQVPLSAFFRDSDAGENGAVVPGRPRLNDQLEPDGGFAAIDTFRNRGEKSILNPLDVTVTTSVVPGAVMQEEQADGSKAREQYSESTRPVGRISDENMRALVELEREHQAHTNRLVQIIAEQQKQIADLTTRLARVAEGKGATEHATAYYDRETNCDAVAEEKK